MSSFKDTNTNTNTNLKSAKIAFLNDANPGPTFGTLEVISEEITESEIRQLQLYLNIDVSGSMGEKCKDGNTKIHHVVTVITNLLTALYNEFKYQKISVIINGFETNIHKILDVENLIDQNLESDIISKISKLFPLNSTNIEIALKTASEILDTSQVEGEKVHILLTDGNATDGITDPNILKTFIPKTSKNIILGIGTDYDATSLQIISSTKSTIFKHINEAETSGLCVGEIIHAIEFQTMKDLNISIDNGEIYNFETGQWSNILKVDSIASEQIKTYHIRTSSSPSSSPSSSSINNVQVTMNWTARNIQYQHSVSEHTLSDDIIKYKHRQEVLELLHIALEFSKTKYKSREKLHMTFLDNSSSDDSDIDSDLDENETTNMLFDKFNRKQQRETENRNQQKDINQRLKLLTLKLMGYMEENQLEKDIFYIRLCKDLTVAIDSFDKDNSDILIHSRLDSQGRQETYTYEPDSNDSEEDEYEYEAIDISFQRGFYSRNTRCTNNQDYNTEEELSDEEINEKESKINEEKEAESSEAKIKDEKEAETDAVYKKMLLKLNITPKNNKNNKTRITTPYATSKQLRLMRDVSSSPFEYDE